MIRDLQHSAATLLAEAAQAGDSFTNGLLNRGDLEDTIRRLSKLTSELMHACESLKHERDALITRLKRTQGPTVPQNDHSHLSIPSQQVQENDRRGFQPQIDCAAVC